MNEVTMKERLVSAINEIRNDKLTLMSDEASIKSGVILRLLRNDVGSSLLLALNGRAWPVMLCQSCLWTNHLAGGIPGTQY